MVIEQGAEAQAGYEDGIALGDRMRGERATLGKSLLDVQRELKIKAAYVAAIENADPGAFESPGFIAGYVRSYARYLGLDPDRAFAAFCEESGFTPAHGMAGGGAATAVPGRGRRASPRSPVTLAADRDIFADRRMPYAPPPEAILRRIEPGAVGSLAVLVALIGAVGWGGWAMLQEMQRVTLAPAPDAPGLVAGIDPLAPEADALAEAEAAGPAPPAPDALDRLYRPRALDVPVLVARDGPIASLDPEAPGALAEAERGAAPGSEDPRRDQITPPRFLTAAREPEAVGLGTDRTGIDGAVIAALGEDGAAEEAPVQVVADSAEVLVVAARPSWVRVRAADGTVVLEKIMEAGETYAVPRTEAPATLRTGNAGGVYFAVAGETFGPAGEGPVVVSDVALSPEAVTGGFDAVDLSSDPELARMVRVAEAAPAPLPGAEEAEAGVAPAPDPGRGPASPGAD